MNRPWLWCTVAALCCGFPCSADELAPRPELDSTVNPRLLDTHFTRYGFEPLKTIHRQNEWARIKLPESTKERNVSQTGLYSYVALAGDFEVEATYGFVEVPTQKGGYGMSCGIAVDTNGPDGMLSLARAYRKNRSKSGYQTNRKALVDGQTQQSSEFYPTRAKTGRLAIRREKAELICLVQEDKGEWQELCRVPYTAGTVRQVRLYADTGGSATGLDVWIGAVRIRAEEITGGFPKGERRSGLGWWHALAALCAVTGTAWLLSRRQQSKWPWPRRE